MSMKEKTEMIAITPNDKVGDVVRIWPRTMKVFARYKLDLCCGAVHPLVFVAEKHHLDLGFAQRLRVSGRRLWPSILFPANISLSNLDRPLTYL